MHQRQSGAPVVVGIDGSPSAVHAAEWASDEALRRGGPLRLVHVIQSLATDIRSETELAEAALRDAHDAIIRTGKPVTIQTAIVRGLIAASLVTESAGADLLCLGSEGIAHRAPKLRGAIATAVAQPALCQVAIIRSHGKRPPAAITTVAVLVDDSDKVGAVVRVALEESRLRNAGLLALRVAAPRAQFHTDPIGKCLADWLNRNPDVPSEILDVTTDLPSFLATRVPAIGLLVAGNAMGQQAERLIGPYARFVLRDTDCSILLVRT